MQSYTVADYIIDRLAQLKAGHIFGVAGNYTAQFLSRAYASKKITCVNTTNELEAGYAADAYSRMRGIGVACVTYGVGSFSLYNAIAGAFVEHCPVVLINGSADADQVARLNSQGVLFAHAIDPLRTDQVIFGPITAATTAITDAADAPSEIDRVLRACVEQSAPVYLEVRDRVWLHECARPGDWRDVLEPPNPSEAQKKKDQDIDTAVAAAVKDVVARARQAKKPVLWAGEWLQRRGLANEFEKLVQVTGWAYTTTLMGKSLISEANEKFIGVYDSAFARADVKKVVEDTDCLIALGTILGSFYGEIVQKQYEKMILVNDDAVRIGRYLYPNVPLKRFVPMLLEALSPVPPTGQSLPEGFAEVRQTRAGRADAGHSGLVDTDQKLTWDNFFARMHAFIDNAAKGMRVMVDTSLALFPAADLVIKESNHFIAQTAWLSIGYTTGASVGASFAANDRVIALAGDGGFQMVPQVLSTLAANKKPAIIFVFNNELYGIEQYLVDKSFYIEGATKPPEFFNVLPKWNYLALAEAFGARGFRADTLRGLEDALAKAAALKDVPALIEVVLDKKDLPAEVAATVPRPSALAAPAAQTTIAPAAFN